MRLSAMITSVTVLSLLTIACLLLSGCITDIWSGASLIYDRHNIYKQIGDVQLGLKASHSLAKERFPCTTCAIDVTVFNGDILLTGYVPNTTVKQEAQNQMERLAKHRRIFNALSVDPTEKSSVQDAWITAKIRGQIFADSDIDPHPFKVVTSAQTVYLLGDVDSEQAAKVISMARHCEGVKRVVVLLRYCNFSPAKVNAM